jgi:hypothetical protein
MMSRTLFAATFAAVAILSQPADSAPQVFALGIDARGSLSGPGGEILRAQLSDAQFILYGEDHGFADSPIVLRALAHDARAFGFRRLVVEVGPTTTRLVERTLAQKGIDGVHALVHESPLAIPFLSLKEDDELASDFLGNDAKRHPYLWGVDQEFIGSPSIHLASLAALAPNTAAREHAQQLLAEEKDAASKGAQDKFLMVRFHGSDFDALAAEFRGSPVALNIIAELRESAAIYQLWMGGHNYENNARRAHLLAQNFLSNYRSAADPQPKVIFKMGVEHMALGTTTVNTVDLGTLATSIARADEHSALRVMFLPMGGHNRAFAPKPGNPTTVETYDSADAKEFFAAIGLDTAQLYPTQWTLVPLEPIRQSLDTKGIDALKPFARFALLGFDYVVTTPDAKPATFLY